MSEHREILTIQNRKGIHARAAAKFVRAVEAFDAQVQVRKLSKNHQPGAQDELPVSGSSILALMMLGAECGARIEVSALGSQAAQALQSVRDLINRKFDEE
jgi:phosphocarrier protein